jgi:hypothetical protein
MHPFRLARLLLIACLLLITAGASFAQISIAIRIGPPPLPVYVQPPCPAEGYIWVPGYWAWDNDYDDYYWVPGTWVLAPEVGYLWTPGYWAWGGEGFIFHEGYWGPQVGFYGGIAYGFGYFGEGFEGGRWEGGHFFYNRSVTNVNITNIHNVYNTTVINNTTVNRISYNGGEGGITARPTSQDEIAARERHLAPVGAQTEHAQAARGNQNLRASVNRGKPPIAATPRPGAFNEHEVVAAKQAGGPYHPAPNRPNSNESRGGGASAPRPEANTSRPDVPRPPMHAADLPPHERPASRNSGDAKLDQKYQQQQEKLYAKQQQEHQKLQQQQERDHQRMQQEQAKQANAARQQQMEQRHQQQTQQMEQRHTEQQQHLQKKQQPHGEAPKPH